MTFTTFAPSQSLIAREISGRRREGQSRMLRCMSAVPSIDTRAKW